MDYTMARWLAVKADIRFKKIKEKLQHDGVEAKHSYMSICKISNLN